VTERIYLSSPDIGPAEEAAVLRAMRSGWVAPLGPEVDTFEQELAEVARRRYAVALSSGTAALHLGLLNLGVTAGDVVITSTMTFAATANAIVYTGATPVFVDCDESANMDVDVLAKAVEDQRLLGRRVAAIIPVDLFGRVAAYERIDEIATDHAVPVLADSAESLGAQRLGRPAGSFGHAAALSFNGNKIMTTSGGGALLTDDEGFAARARYLASQARQPVIHYEHTDVGYNYRLSNLLAALGRAQLARLSEMMERRRAWRVAYRRLFDGVPGVRVMGTSNCEPTGTQDNCWLTSILVDPHRAGWTAPDLQAYLAASDIESRPLWKPMHLQPVFAATTSYITGVSEEIYATGLSLPSGSVLTDAQFERVVSVICDFLARNSA
jgi:dTDP-4-amino-4,6-dideoxygalactose transaminase